MRKDVGVGATPRRGICLRCSLRRHRPPGCAARSDRAASDIMGKDTALGGALREHGHLGAVAEVMTVAFGDLRGVGTITVAAGTFIGRFRATRYRALAPPARTAHPILQSERRKSPQA